MTNAGHFTRLCICMSQSAMAVCPFVCLSDFGNYAVDHDKGANFFLTIPCGPKSGTLLVFEFSTLLHAL